MTDEALRELWRHAGGHFFGPHVEHGSMPESKLLPFLRSLSVPAEGWVAVGTRLPDPRTIVWATISPDDGPEYPPYAAEAKCLDRLGERRWLRYDSIDELCIALSEGEAVTHWQPLPAAAPKP